MAEIDFYRNVYLYTVELPNVIEIEGLLFPGFGRVLANTGSPWKTGFPLHEGTKKWSCLGENF